VVVESLRADAPPVGEPLYRAVVVLAKATVKLMGWEIAISGEENIPASGPALIASNHVGLLDFVFLGFAADRRRRLVRFMAMQEAFDHRLGGPLLRGMRHIPVDRTGDPTVAYRRAVEALESGDVVGIHPEARINRMGLPGPGKSGAVRLAQQTGAPLIPAGLWGSQRILEPGRRPRFPRRLRITVHLDPPLEATATTPCDHLTDTLMERIRGLVVAARGHQAGED
jgi:1-acyl-sn-glycerol-3-phosphate acyltransferase